MMRRTPRYTRTDTLVPYTTVCRSALMMEVVAGVMAGSAFGGGVRNQYFNFDEPQDVGHCFIALRPDLFMPMETYRERMSELERRCKASPRASGFADIQMPGEPEARTEAARLSDGLPIEADDAQTPRGEHGGAEPVRLTQRPVGQHRATHSSSSKPR